MLDECEDLINMTLQPGSALSGSPPAEGWLY